MFICILIILCLVYFDTSKGSFALFKRRELDIYIYKIEEKNRYAMNALKDRHGFLLKEYAIVIHFIDM
jgi:hypothetical protein